MEDVQPLLNFKLWPLLAVAIIGLIFYSIIKLLKRIVFASNGGAPWLGGLRDRWPVLERLFWAIFVLGFLITLISLNPLVGAIMAALMLATTWGFIRNYVAGILVLAEGAIKVGQSIRFDTYEGKVVTLNALNCDVELDDTGKETLKVPYSKLASQLLVKTSPSENIVTQTSILEVDATRDAIAVEGQIEDVLINMPWLVAEEGYSIERLENGENRLRFRVVLQGIDKKQLRRGVEQLKVEMG